MASSMIHIAIANEINKKLKRDNKKLLIGTIAPDISKLIGETKVKSHFLIEKNSDIPNLQMFLNKYKEKLIDDFVMGYYIHLYTDYLWFKYFMPEVVDKDKLILTKIDGKKIKCAPAEIIQYFYNDYTNLNTLLLDEYNLDLKIFYEELPKIENIIEEIPMDKINLIVDNAGIIVKNAVIKKDLVFDIENIKQFIKLSVNIILGNLIELNLLNN